MDFVAQFINDPLVAPLYGLLVISLISMLLGMYRAAQQGTFDWKKIPGILDSTVLQKVIPLAALGGASVLVTDATTGSALTVAYLGGCASAYAGEISALIEKVTGGFTATTTAQDRGVTS